jgi:hypothetical protein
MRRGSESNDNVMSDQEQMKVDEATSKLRVEWLVWFGRQKLSLACRVNNRPAQPIALLFFSPYLANHCIDQSQTHTTRALRYTMSDREGGDDDVGLPKATVYKLIQGELRFVSRWLWRWRLCFRFEESILPQWSC